MQIFGQKKMKKKEGTEKLDFSVPSDRPIFFTAVQWSIADSKIAKRNNRSNVVR